MKDAIKKLNYIQQNLNAPKNQRNTFGNYNYRSAEDILEAVKSLLGDDWVVLLSDTLQSRDGRWYVEASATLTNGEDEVSVTAEAREAQDKKGMDAAQITGAASSYARKYAMCGLFAIDDTKDADTDAYTQRTKPAKTEKKSKTTAKLSGPQRKKIYALANEIDADLDKVKKHTGIESINDLTKSQAMRLIDQMENKKRELEIEEAVS